MINGTIFEKKKKLLHIKCAFRVFQQLLSSWFYPSSSPSFFFDWNISPRAFNVQSSLHNLVDPLYHPTHLIMSRSLSSSRSLQNTLSLRSARFCVLPIRANTLKLLECRKHSQILHIRITSNYFQLQIFPER